MFVILMLFFCSLTAYGERKAQASTSKPIDNQVTVLNTSPRSVAPLKSSSFPSGKKPKFLHFKPLNLTKTEEDRLNKQAPAIKLKAERIIREKKQEILKEARSFAQEFPHSVLLPFRLYVTEFKLFHSNKSDILSARMILYQYTGGAHGGSLYYSWNWSKSQQKFLSLGDALSLKDFSSLRVKVREALFESQKQGNEYDKYRKDHIHRGTQKPEDFKIWNFHQDGIRIIFPEYQVASYAGGRFEVFVPNFP